MNPTIWGPHYWFFLHSVARHYPKHPTPIHRKIHYRLIMNFHEFIPDSKCAKSFSALLKENPISPYLDSRKDFMRWTNHIHNAVNAMLEKEQVHFERFEEELEHSYRSNHKEMPTRYLAYVIFILALIAVAVCMK